MVNRKRDNEREKERKKPQQRIKGEWRGGTSSAQHFLRTQRSNYDLYQSYIYLSTFILFKIHFLKWQMTKTNHSLCTIKSPASPHLLTNTVWVLPQMLSTTKTSPESEGTQEARERFLIPRNYPGTSQTISMPIHRLPFSDKSASFYCVAPTTNGFFFLPPTSPWVFFFSAAIARTHSYAWAPWQVYLPDHLVNKVNSGAALCYADLTGLPRGQTSASHSGLG